MGNETVNDKEFVREMQPLRNDLADLQSRIRSAMTKILGELGAISALSYTGDASDGDLAAFARRVTELFGLGASKILSELASSIVGVGRRF
jgi:hypothetical protein